MKENDTSEREHHSLIGATSVLAVKKKMDDNDQSVLDYHNRLKI